jgi:hypothetical protein
VPVPGDRPVATQTCFRRSRLEVLPLGVAPRRGRGCGDVMALREDAHSLADDGARCRCSSRAAAPMNTGVATAMCRAGPRPCAVRGRRRRPEVDRPTGLQPHSWCADPRRCHRTGRRRRCSESPLTPPRRSRRIAARDKRNTRRTDLPVSAGLQILTLSRAEVAAAVPATEGELVLAIPRQ